MMQLSSASGHTPSFLDKFDLIGLEHNGGPFNILDGKGRAYLRKSSTRER